MAHAVPHVRLTGAVRTLVAVLAGSCLLLGEVVPLRAPPALARSEAPLANRVNRAATRPQNSASATESMPSLTLAEHDAGQAADAFTGAGSAANATLFRFKLTAEVEDATIGGNGLTIGVAPSGVASGDLANVTLIEDTNNNGVVDSLEGSAGTLESPLDISDGGITFSNLTVPLDAAGRGYILRADVANLAGGDSLTLSLPAGNIANVTSAVTGAPIAPAGAVSSAQHNEDSPLPAVDEQPAGEAAEAEIQAGGESSGPSQPAAILINEVVTDPQTDWSTTGFNGANGGGSITDSDEWIELHNRGLAAVDLTNYSLTFADSSPATFSFNAPGSSALLFTGGGAVNNFQPGEYLVIGNPPDAINNDVYVTLRDGSSALIDDVEIGDDPEGDGNGDGAPDGGSTNGDASSPLDEAIARVPNGADTDNDVDDLTRQAARIGLDNGGSLTLGENGGGQAANAFGGGGPSITGATLYRFSLTAIGETSVVGAGLTIGATASGIVAGDLANLTLVEDTNNNGVIDGGESGVGTLEAPLDISDGITFSNFTVPINAAGTGYVLRGDLNNLAPAASLVLALPAANITNVTGGATGKAITPTGAVSSAAHTAPASPGAVAINEVVTNAQTDWSTNNFDGTPGVGTVSEVDEYVELFIRTAGLNLTGWTIELTDSTPESGSLTAGGAFAVSRYVGAGSFTNTAAGDFLLLGNPNGTGMNNDIYLTLRDGIGTLIDDVEIGDDFEGDGNGDGAPDGAGSSGDATGPADEAIARAPDGRDTGDDKYDFVQQPATPGATNGGRLDLGENGGGQATNAFAGGVSFIAGADLYRFSLTADDESVTIGKLSFGFLTYEFNSGDFGDLSLIQDTNNNGVVDPGEPVVGSLETPLNIRDGLTFSNLVVPYNPAGAGYILRGSLDRIRRGRLLDVWLTAGQITNAIGGTTGKVIPVGGKVNLLRHGKFDFTKAVWINEVVPHPRQDYNHDGVVNATGDEYIELINVGESPVHLGGWLLDDIPAAGSDFFHIHLGTIIPPHKVMVFLRDTTHLALNDDYDFVQLRYPDGSLVDEVFWDHDPGPDASISRDAAGPGAFSFDWLPTPGMFNKAREAANPTPAVAPLIVARAWDDGAYVSVVGRVIGPSPLFGARAVYVQDDSGAGVVIYLGRGDFPPMRAGQRITAYGYLRTRNGERQLYLRSLDQMSLGDPGPEPLPARIATGQVGEATEGRLVTIFGRVVRLETNAVWLDDGSGRARVYFRSSIGFRRPPMRQGQFWRITGIVSEFTTSASNAPGYRVLVRFESDVVRVTEAGLPLTPEPGEMEEPTEEPTQVAFGHFVRVSGRVIPPLSSWYRPPP